MQRSARPCAGHQHVGSRDYVARRDKRGHDRLAFAMAKPRISSLAEHAPAKINLTLAVLGRRADGYHLLDSLVAFAGVGDRLTLAPSDRLSLRVRGEGARAAGP